MNGDQMVLYTVLGQKVLQYKKGEAGTIAPPKSTPSTSPCSVGAMGPEIIY